MATYSSVHCCMQVSLFAGPSNKEGQFYVYPQGYRNLFVSSSICMQPSLTFVGAADQVHDHWQNFVVVQFYYIHVHIFLLGR